MKNGMSVIEGMVIVAIAGILIALIIPAITKQNSDPSVPQRPGESYRTVVIDGCQYIEVDAGVAQCHVYSLTHKGNCTNPIHFNMEIEKSH